MFFALGGFDRNASVWISYGFIHFAYFMLLLTPKLIHGEKKWTELGFPIYAMSSAYFFVEFFVGVLFILIALNGYMAALLIQIFLAGLYGIALMSYMIANEYTSTATEERQNQVSYIKEASATLKVLLERIDDKETKKKVEKVYDAIYSSPVKSHPNLASAENRILQSIGTLEEAISAGNTDGIIALAGTLETAINERNSRLKTYN